MITCQRAMPQTEEGATAPPVARYAAHRSFRRDNDGISGELTIGSRFGF